MAIKWCLTLSSNGLSAIVRRATYATLDTTHAHLDIDHKALLKSLNPDGYGDRWDPEPWPQYRRRAKSLLPNFPELAIEQWLYRHYDCAVNDYGWLNLPLLTFCQETWPTDRVLAEVNEWEGHGLIEKMTRLLRTDSEQQQHWLGVRMIGTGTWPVPIMIIRNSCGLKRPDGLRLWSPYHLMEGHHRLGYLRALVEDDRWQPAERHEVLAVSVDPSETLDYWPLNN